MIGALAVLAQMLLEAGVVALVCAVDAPPRHRRDFEPPVKSRVTALQAELATLRRLMADHGLKLRVTAAARKRLFLEMNEDDDARRVCAENIRKPLAGLIRTGRVGTGDTVTAECVMDEIVLRV